MPTTPRPPDPQRYALVEALLRKGHADRDIVRLVCAEFGVSDTTVRSDLHRLWGELEDEDAAARNHRRNTLRYQIRALQVEAREVADRALAGVEDGDGKILVPPDARSASISHGTSEKLFGRLLQIDGVSESDKIKADLLKQKIMGGLSPAELDEALAAEVQRMIATMPDHEFDVLRRKRAEWKRRGRPTGKPRHPAKAKQEKAKP